MINDTCQNHQRQRDKNGSDGVRYQGLLQTGGPCRLIRLADSPIRPASCFPAPGCALLQRQFNAVFAPAVGLKQQKTQHAKYSAVQDESEDNARSGNYRVGFVPDFRVYRDPDKPAVCAFMTLPAGVRQVVFIDGGLGVVFFIYIMQGTGSVTAEAVGGLAGA